MHARRFWGVTISVIIVTAIVAICYLNSDSSILQRSHFRQATVDQAGMQSDIRDLQSLMGLAKWKFEYQMPPHQTLLVDMQAQLDGQPLPEMSGTYRIVPNWSDVTTTGAVIVSRYTPAWTTSEPHKPRWQFYLSASGERSRFGSTDHMDYGNWLNPIPAYELPATNKPVARGSGEIYKSLGNLNEGSKHDIWTYHEHWLTNNEDILEQHNFQYQLSVQMVPLTPNDDLGTVQPTGPLANGIVPRRRRTTPTAQ